MKTLNCKTADKRSDSRIATTVLALLIALTIFCPLAIGQQGGRGDRDGQNSSREDRDRDKEREREREKERQREKERDREKEREREKWRKDFDLKEFLQKLDIDKSNVVEVNELTSGRTRRFLGDMGVNTENPIRINETVKRVKAKSDKKRENARKDFEDKVRPKLNSFGAEPDAYGVAGFGASENVEPQVASFDERISGMKESDFDEAVLKDAKSIMQTYDRDDSKFLEGDEIRRIRWQSPSPDESDTNSDGRISLFELAKRIQDRTDRKSKDESRNDKDRDRDRERRDRENDRGRRYDGNRGSDSSSRSSESSSKGSSNASETKSDSSSQTSKSKADAYQAYVDGLFKKYDRDKDSKLSPEELKKMRRPLKGDYDKDGFITKFEATKYLTDGAEKKSGKSSRDGSSSPTKRSSNSSGGGSSKSSSSSQRGTFSDLDTNGDGQIQMSEFSTQWDEDTLQSFRKSDADQNGILSNEEWKTKSE